MSETNRVNHLTPAAQERKAILTKVRETGGVLIGWERGQVEPDIARQLWQAGLCRVDEGGQPRVGLVLKPV